MDPEEPAERDRGATMASQARRHAHDRQSSRHDSATLPAEPSRAPRPLAYQSEPPKHCKTRPPRSCQTEGAKTRGVVDPRSPSQNRTIGLGYDVNLRACTGCCRFGHRRYTFPPRCTPIRRRGAATLKRYDRRLSLYFVLCTPRGVSKWYRAAPAQGSEFLITRGRWPEHKRNQRHQKVCGYIHICIYTLHDYMLTCPHVCAPASAAASRYMYASSHTSTPASVSTSTSP